MPNGKAIGGLLSVIFVAVFVIVILYVAGSSDSDVVSIPHSDTSTEVSDYGTVEKKMVSVDTNNPNYVLDADGTKHYSISAADSPTIGD